MGRVEGKIAVVTGAARGIGRACAERLAAEGARVVLTDLDAEAGEAVVRGLGGSGDRAFFLTHDVTSEEAWAAVLETIAERLGALHILVNNAGVAASSPVEAMELSSFRSILAVNVEGVFLGVKHALPLLRKSGGGSIINVSSVAGLNGAPNLSAYCASKGAVRLFTKSIALECAALRDGVRVNSVHPGIIETDIWNAFGPGDAGGANRIDLDAVTAIATPLGVKGYPKDIADGVLFLASDEARYVTGSELVIDGGMTAR